MQQPLFHLSGILANLGLTKESNDVLSLVKLGFINEAKILVTVSTYKIVATLKGVLPSGKEAEFGSCIIHKISKDKVKIASGPKSSVWEFHRNIYKKEYEGLGYMNDLLVAAISQVQNNGGTAFNGIGGDIIGTGVSDAGQRHTLEGFGPSLSKTPVIVFKNLKKDCFNIFEASDKDLAKQIFFDSYGTELTDQILDQLFSTPYMKINIEDIVMQRSHYKTITSAFKVIAASSKTSLPVSMAYVEQNNSAENQSSEDYAKLHEKIDSLHGKYRNIAHSIFGYFYPTNKDIFSISDGYSYQRTPESIGASLDRLAKEYLERPNSLADGPPINLNSKYQLYLSSKQELINILIQMAKLDEELDMLMDEEIELENEFNDRASYVGNIRNINQKSNARSKQNAAS